MFNYCCRAEIFPANDPTYATVIETTNFKQLYKLANLEARDFPLAVAVPVCVRYYKNGVHLFSALFDKEYGITLRRLSDGKQIEW